MVDTLENDSIEEQPTIMLPHLVSLSIFFTSWVEENATLELFS